MPSHFMYRSLGKEIGKEFSFIIIFFPIHLSPATDLDEDIKNYFTEYSPADSAVLIFPEYQAPNILQLVTKDESPVKRLKNFLYDRKIYLLSYNELGFTKQLDTNGSEDVLSSEFISQFKQDGLENIFMMRGGLLEADDTFHYILPSLRHSRVFVRVGNILTCGNEVNFIAFCLLPFFESNPRFVYCDSSSISPVVYAATLIRTQITRAKRNNRPIIPMVESFRAYDGIPDFPFRVNECLVLISTSSSGNMKKELMKKQIEREQIVTLFFNGDAKGDKQILLNLSSVNRPEFAGILKKFPTYSNELECVFCNKNSIPVKLSGDQFLPAKPAIVQVLIKKEHRPKWLNEFMLEFHGKGIIRCHFGKDVRKIREFYLDLEKVHEEIDVLFNHSQVKHGPGHKPNYHTKFYKYLENNLPVTVCYIICLPDAASEQMADQIKNYLEKKGSKDIEILPFREFINQPNLIDKAKSGTVLIVSSSIATGKKLYQLSLKFRDFDNLSVSYFFGICRTPTKEVLKTLTSDLEFRKDLLNENRLGFVQNIHIPDRHTDFGKELENSPWAKEKEFIREEFQPVFAEKGFDQSVLERRVQIIEQAEQQSGMTDELFWPNSNNLLPLALRKSFAFFDFNYYDPHGKSIVSQSEVYFAISSVLHNLRNNLEEERVHLIQHEHRRSIISPQCFSRYSDGIIQSSLLRSAQPGELNYGIDFNISYNMKRTLVNLFEDPASHDAEALYEFLYAIAIGKLILLTRDISDFIALVKKKYSENEIVNAFCALIVARYEK